MRDAALKAKADGLRLIACIGEDVPFDQLAAQGLSPLRLNPNAETPVSFAGDGELAQTLSWRARALLSLISDVTDVVDGLLITHDDVASPHVFAALRELPGLKRTGRNTFFLDLLPGDSAAAQLYNDERLKQCGRWLDGLGVPPAAASVPLSVAEEPAVEQGGILVVGGREAMPAVYACLESGGTRATGHVPIRTSFEGLAAFEDRLARAIATQAPDAVVHLCLSGDEASPWTVNSARRVSLAQGLAFGQFTVPPGDLSQDLADDLNYFAASFEMPPARAAAVPSSGVKGGRGSVRSHKALESVATFGQYQRDWFAGIRRQAEAGGPFAIVNANAPQEILRAFDVPFVVNQWWASIVAAKRQSGRYAGLLRDHVYPDAVEAYSAQGLAALFDDDAELAPWGGLPRPTQLHAVPDSDATRNLFDAWAGEAQAELFLYNRSIDSRWELPDRWWDRLPEQWDEVLEPERLELMVADLRASVARLEKMTGQAFDPARFRDIMTLVNEQEHYYRLTRDLIATARPAPVSIVDTMPATMVPQWHRGTIWGRDAAKAFYDEVRARAESGAAVCANERLRLMWVGRGLWSDTSFYQQWENSHGAVFVWSMYLALAADGYIRNFDGGRDPMAALAARFLTMGDELRMPTWASAWHLKEAQVNGIDAVIAIDDADAFVLKALSEAGYPVLKLPVSNQGDIQDPAIAEQVSQFLDRLKTEDR